MKEAAFKVCALLLTEEVQKARAADGIKGVVKTEEIANAFGTNIPQFKNLNLKAVYWGENAAQPVRSPEVAGGGYWDISTWDIFRKFIFQNGLDPETALKRFEEEQNENIRLKIIDGYTFS